MRRLAAWILSLALVGFGLGGCGRAEERSEPRPHAPSEAPMTDTSDCVLAYSSGRVTKPESYNYRTFLPERGGLYAIEIFGPVPWVAGEARFDEDMRADRFGHVELAEPVPHPLAPEVSLSRVPVLPPVHRRFRRMSAEETRRRARETRDRMMADPDETYRTHGDPVSTLLGEQGLWSFEHDRPLTDEEIETFEPATIEPEIAGLYRAVVNYDNRLHRLHELDAPAAILATERASLRNALRALFAHVATMELSDEERGRALARCAIPPR